MSVNPLEAITTRELTRVVNREKRPRRALSAMFFPQSTHRNLTTEYAQVDELTGNQELAPFIDVNGEAVAVGQNNGRSYMLETPMISVKRPMTAQKLLLQRMMGSTTVFGSAYDENIIKQIAKDTARLEAAIANREEWMIAMSLRGAISYENEDTGASIKIDLRKPAGNDFVAPNGIWTTGSPKVRQDIRAIKKLANDNEVNTPTVAIGDTTAATALYELIRTGVVVLDKDANTRNLDTAMSVDYSEMGMNYIGMIDGIDFWEYNASFTDQGVTSTFIRPGYFEFVPNRSTDMDNREMLYGRIMDIDAWEEGADIAERYSFTIRKKEPSSLTQYMKSRPLPWWYRADEIISMKVTA